MNMTMLIIIVAIILVIALIGTLLITKDSDAVYSGEKSLSNQAWMYIAIIPLTIIVGLVFMF